MKRRALSNKLYKATIKKAIRKLDFIINPNIPNIKAMGKNK
ncbi:hypothetical protein OIU83_15455 [Flavobacterium sp. LS1R49]|uniref:Uncharacterized protein n=1 Tax=Flavobacterium shii TaxID=2987687 RepID=A0A9X2ZI01_9FLAO|nr:hypothetical protein [Flavobacterium shii]MCV9929061.1 hypothetical protein [Flavobacterium shii]